MGSITAVVPKELFPVGPVAAIHHVIDEGIRAGIDSFAIVIRRGKEIIMEYVQKIVESRFPAQFTFLFQESPRGVGEAILLSRDFVGEEPFVVLFPDMVYREGENPTIQLLGRYQQQGLSVVCLADVPEPRRHRHGWISGELIGPGVYRLTRVARADRVPKGSPPLSGGGRTLLTSTVFKYPSSRRGAELDDGELLNWLITKEGVLGCLVPYSPFDIGSMDGYKEAVAHFS